MTHCAICSQPFSSMNPQARPGVCLLCAVPKPPAPEDAPDLEGVCAICYHHMQTDDGCEPTKICHHCAHDEVDRLQGVIIEKQAEIDRLKAHLESTAKGAFDAIQAMAKDSAAIREKFNQAVKELEHCSEFLNDHGRPRSFLEGR